jgi:hypothetical protein
MKILLTSVVIATALIFLRVDALMVDPMGALLVGLYGLLGVILMPGLGLFLIARGAKKRQRNTRMWGIALLAAAIGAFLVASRITNEQEAASMVRGDQLLDAIGLFHQRSGSYPEELDELVPEFARSIPDSSMGLFRALPFQYDAPRKDRGPVLRFHTTNFYFYERGPGSDWRFRD